MSTINNDFNAANNYILKKIVQDRPIDEEMTLYNEWAKTYEKDMSACDYHGQIFIAREFDKFNLPKDCSVLDLAAGTGWVGEELKKFGYTNVDALDGSIEMLNLAKKKGVYRYHVEALVLAERRLPIPDNVYDGVVCAGAVIPGHIGIEDLIDVVRIVKPGGLISWLVSYQYDDRDTKFTRKYMEMVICRWVNQGKWIPVDGYPKDIDNYKTGFQCTVYVMKVC